MKDIEEIKDLFKDVDVKQRALIDPLIEEVVFMKNQLTDLQKLPHVRIHPKNPNRQEITAAGKQYKNIIQSYNSAVKTLLTVLYRSGSDDGDELLNKLKEFE
jgi:hypothetical protein